MQMLGDKQLLYSGRCLVSAHLSRSFLICSEETAQSWVSGLESALLNKYHKMLAFPPRMYSCLLAARWDLPLLILGLT